MAVPTVSPNRELQGVGKRPLGVVVVDEGRDLLLTGCYVRHVAVNAIPEDISILVVNEGVDRVHVGPVEDLLLVLFNNVVVDLDPDLDFW